MDAGWHESIKVFAKQKPKAVKRQGRRFTAAQGIESEIPQDPERGRGLGA
jgi:hypothetical protein